MFNKTRQDKTLQGNIFKIGVQGRDKDKRKIREGQGKDWTGMEREKTRQDKNFYSWYSSTKLDLKLFTCFFSPRSHAVFHEICR